MMQISRFKQVLLHRGAKFWYSFVPTLHLSSEFPSNHASIQASKLSLLSCPIDAYHNKTYMGVSAEISNSGELLFKWRGEYSYLLLMKEGRTYR